MKKLYRADDFLSGKGVYRGIFDNYDDAHEACENGQEDILKEPESGLWSEINIFTINKDFKDITEFTESELMEFWENGNIVRTVFLGA